jgi:hypothetical protein
VHVHVRNSNTNNNSNNARERFGVNVTNTVNNVNTAAANTHSKYPDTMKSSMNGKRYVNNNSAHNTVPVNNELISTA